ncbi:MAG: tripartite tricarboxylate transporter permease [Clostridiales bacterium]|jgi:putative tricarboxylic transport membrane protein|nr:tripartite tricarboxylate transporter permease [Clostridiales bacterium]
MRLFLEGFASLMSFECLFYMVLGTAVGILFGAMPGMTATLAVAVFIPITYAMNVNVSMGLLMSLYIGGISGGLISAVLINIPGTPASVASTFDGMPMARKGEAGKALGVGIFYSFIATVMSTIALIFISPPLARIAFNFGYFEYFAITSCSFVLVAGLAGRDLVKGLISTVFGVFFSIIGMAPLDGVKRFTFGSPHMAAGLSSLPVLIGLFALPELIKYVSESDTGFTKLEVPKFRGLGFTLKEFLAETGNMFRSWLIGLSVGLIPGIGGATSNLLAYAAAKNSSKHPEKFGTGIMSGIVASETSNNASIGGAMVPLLSLGIPGDAVTAILLGALMVKGIQPGPMFFRNNLNTAYAIFAALLISSVMMLIIEMGALRLFVRLLSIPRRILLPIVMVICAVGAYTSTSTIFSMWVLFAFGIIGYMFSVMKLPLPPCIIGFVLGSDAELYLRRGLQMTGGEFAPFLTSSAITICAYSIAALFLAWKIVNGIRKKLLAKLSES